MSKKKLFMIETISMFRHTYVVEGDELSHAYDEVSMKDSGNPADEFYEASQRFLGETISTGREITKKEFDKYLEIVKTDEDESSSYWLGDALIRKIDYTK